jgi:pimeloyl-ACP methyl ester carboxylesterase
MTEKHITVGDKKIYYNVSGQGIPVLLIHGFAEDNDIWRYQQAALSGLCRLIIPDLPGSGKSAMISDMSMEGLADCIHKIIEEEIKDRSATNAAGGVIMIGHSMGGYITLAFAGKYPGMLRALGLFHSTAFPDTEEKKANRQRGITFIQTHGSYEFIKQSAPNLFTEAYRIKNGAIIAEMIDRYKNFDPLALVSYYEAMIQRPDRTAILQSVNKPFPVLFIMGKYDTAVPFEDSLRQSYMPQHAFIELMENSAHMGMWEEKEKSTDSLLRFLQHITV